MVRTFLRVVPHFSRSIDERTLLDTPTIEILKTDNKSREHTIMGNQSSSEGGHSRSFGRSGNSLGLSRSELEKRCKPSGYVPP